MDFGIDNNGPPASPPVGFPSVPHPPMLPQEGLPTEGPTWLDDIPTLPGRDDGPILSDLNDMRMLPNEDPPAVPQGVMMPPRFGPVDYPRLTRLLNDVEVNIAVDRADFIVAFGENHRDYPGHTLNALRLLDRDAIFTAAVWAAQGAAAWVVRGSGARRYRDDGAAFDAMLYPLFRLNIERALVTAAYAPAPAYAYDPAYAPPNVRPDFGPDLDAPHETIVTPPTLGRDIPGAPFPIPIQLWLRYWRRYYRRWRRSGQTEPVYFALGLQDIRNGPFSPEDDPLSPSHRPNNPLDGRDRHPWGPLSPEEMGRRGHMPAGGAASVRPFRDGFTDGFLIDDPFIDEGFTAVSPSTDPGDDFSEWIDWSERSVEEGLPIDVEGLPTAEEPPEL